MIKNINTCLYLVLKETIFTLSVYINSNVLNSYSFIEMFNPAFDFILRKLINNMNMLYVCV